MSETSEQGSLQLLDQLVGTPSWNAIIVGDGSGSSWSIGGGWACVLIDRLTLKRKLFCGSMKPGTVQIAEMMPYLHAMLWYTARGNPGRSARQVAMSIGRSVNVHIVTDSETVAKSGNRVQGRSANLPLWAAFDQFAAMGYALRFHHVPRETVPLNILADEVSRSARLKLDEAYGDAVAKLRKRFPALPEDLSPYDF